MSIQSFYDTEPTSKNLDIIANEPEYNVHRGITYYLNRLMSSAAAPPDTAQRLCLRSYRFHLRRFLYGPNSSSAKKKRERFYKAKNHLPLAQ